VLVKRQPTVVVVVVAAYSRMSEHGPHKEW